MEMGDLVWTWKSSLKPRDEIDKGKNAEKEKKRTKDGQRKLTGTRVKEGEGRASSGVPPAVCANARVLDWGTGRNLLGLATWNFLKPFKRGSNREMGVIL